MAIDENPSEETHEVQTTHTVASDRSIRNGVLSIVIGLLIGLITYWLFDNWLEVTGDSFDCTQQDFPLVLYPALASPLVLLLATVGVVLGVRSIRGRHAQATAWGKLFTLIGLLVLGVSALAYLIFTVQLLGGYLIVFVMCGGTG